MAVVGFLLIGIGQSVPNRHAIENDLTSRSTKALQSADIEGLTVSFTGRDATITGAGSTRQAQQAQTVVRAVKGVRVAKAWAAFGGAKTPSVTETPSATETPSVTETPSATETPSVTPSAAATPTEAPTPAAQAASIPIGFTLVDGTITITGTIRSLAERYALVSAVQAAGHGWLVVDRMIIDGSLGAVPPPVRGARLPALTRLLATAPRHGTNLVIQYSKGDVILRGTPATAARERALLGAAAATVRSRSQVVDGLDVR